MSLYVKFKCLHLQFFCMVKNIFYIDKCLEKNDFHMNILKRIFILCKKINK